MAIKYCNDILDIDANNVHAIELLETENLFKKVEDRLIDARRTGEFFTALKSYKRAYVVFYIYQIPEKRKTRIIKDNKVGTLLSSFRYSQFINPIYYMKYRHNALTAVLKATHGARCQSRLNSAPTIMPKMLTIY